MRVSGTIGYPFRYNKAIKLRNGKPQKTKIRVATDRRVPKGKKGIFDMLYLMLLVQIAKKIVTKVAKKKMKIILVKKMQIKALVIRIIKIMNLQMKIIMNHQILHQAVIIKELIHLNQAQMKEQIVVLM